MTLAGIAEIAEHFSLSRTAALYWISRPGFPDPVADLSCGRIWDLEQIAEWREAGGIRDQARPGPKREAMRGTGKPMPAGFDPTIPDRRPFTKLLLDDPRGGMSWSIFDRDGQVEEQGITGDHDAASILCELNGGD
jgi:hypothetical protein